MALSQIEKHELMNRTKGLRDDELQVVLKYIPTVSLLSEIARRQAFINDTLVNICTLWDDVTMEKPIDQMDLIEQEDLIKRLRRCMYYGNE